MAIHNTDIPVNKVEMTISMLFQTSGSYKDFRERIATEKSTEPKVSGG
jgi:hypothetical protein